MGYWKVILPYYTKNFVKNPCAMGGSDYAAIAGATINLDTNYGYFGYRNFKVAGTADNQGIQLSLETLPYNTHYVTVRHYGAIPSAWDWSVDGTNFGTPALIGQEGNWYVYGYQFTGAQCSASVLLRIQKNGAAAFTWYIGHVQVEEGTAPGTTPVTGDLKGFCKDGYEWIGTPNSSGSERHSWERSGGQVIDLEDTYNFKVLYGIGTGMPPIQHNVQPLALLPGALYQGHKVLPRILDLVSGAKANTNAEISQARSDFIEAIKPDRVTPEQPVVIRYTGILTTNPIEFHGVYDSGMEFQTSSGKIDKPIARFICYDPFIYETHTEGKELVRWASISNANDIIRAINAVWSNISADFVSAVYCITEGKDGCIYIGGTSQNVGDTSGDYIVKWNPVTETLSSLGSGLFGGSCLCLLTAPNGDIYAGGTFSAAGGVANTAYIAKWNGSAWVSLSTTSLGNTVFALAWGMDGTLYVGGQFTNAGGVANADYVCRYTGTSWAAIGDVLGTNGVVYSMEVSAVGMLYITGQFSQVNSITVNCIAKYIGTPTVGLWTALGTGLNNDGRTIQITPGGKVYVGGNFTTANGVTCNRVAEWNGITFKPLGAGASGTVYRLRFDLKGNLWAGGDFTSMGGLALADRMAKWNGTSWLPIPVNLPGSATCYDFCFIGENIYIGYNTSGTAYGSVRTQVDVANTGSHSTYPKIGISRADDGTQCTIKYIRNETTRQNLYLNYELQKGEQITIDLTQGNKSVVSSYYGPILRAILRGSDFSKFCLQGGTNYISVYTTEAGSPTIMSWIEYKVTHWAADTAI